MAAPIDDALQQALSEIGRELNEQHQQLGVLADEKRSIEQRAETIRRRVEELKGRAAMLSRMLEEKGHRVGRPIDLDAADVAFASDPMGSSSTDDDPDHLYVDIEAMPRAGIIRLVLSESTAPMGPQDVAARIQELGWPGEAGFRAVGASLAALKRDGDTKRLGRAQWQLTEQGRTKLFSQ